MGYKVGFCVSGKGRLAMAAIRNSLHLNIMPKILIADHNADSGLETLCTKYDVEFVRLPKMPRDNFNDLLFQSLTKQEMDLVCLTFDKVIATELVSFYKGRMINVHPGLLPAFVGPQALERAELKGVRFAGATIHEVVDEVDAGSIISQCIVSTGLKESSSEFGSKIYKQLEPMFLQTIKWYSEDRIFKDKLGRIWVKNASYGCLPVSPAIELKALTCDSA
jgi:phosphoribosylglycinamide formyltransferase 1